MLYAGGQLFPKHRLLCKPAAVPDRSTVEKAVFNEVQIQMFSREFQAALFGLVVPEYGPPPRSVCADLEAHGITLRRPTSSHPPVRFPLPRMNGANVKEHFYNVAKTMTDPYVNLLSSFPSQVPPMPTEWSANSGWTR